MTIGTIHWGAHAGLLEEVAAVFIAQDHPAAIRRTPASGDGGVDVLVAVEGGWHVFQVKSFPNRVGGGRRRQIEDSLTEAIRDPRLPGGRIVDWSLVVPIDPTAGEQAWFAGLAASAPFRCTWLGKVWWDSMASEHPHVVDYYFRDGRQRIEERVQAMTGALDLLRRPPTALDVGTQLDVMRRRLDLEDPHYRYSFHIGDLPLTDASAPEGTVLIHSEACGDGGGYWSVYVTPKHRYALTDSPIGGELTIIAFDEPRGIDIRDQLQAFRDFGSELVVPEGAVSGTLRAPGGLTTSFDGGSLTVSPLAPSSGLEETRLKVIASNGEEHEVVLRTSLQSTGENGGGHLKAADGTGLLRLEARLFPPTDDWGGVWWELTLGDVVDRPAVDVLPLVRLLVAAADGGTLIWMERHGPTAFARHTFERRAEGGDVAYYRSLLPILEDLAAVQQKVSGAVVVPEAVKPGQLADLRQVAEMITQGPIIGTWTEGEFGLAPGHERLDLERMFETGGQLLQSGPMVLALDDRTYDIGPGYRYYRFAQLAPTQPLDARRVRVCAGEDDYSEQGLGRYPGR